MGRLIEGLRQTAVKVATTLGRHQFEINPTFRHCLTHDQWRSKSHKSPGNGTFLEATGKTLKDWLNPNQDLL